MATTVGGVMLELFLNGSQERRPRTCSRNEGPTHWAAVASHRAASR